MKTLLHLVLLVMVLGISSKAVSTTRVSKSSGNWGNAGTWTPAGVPACGDSIVILATHTISVTNQQDYSSCASPMKIIVYGKIMFYNGSKLSLSCGSYVIIYPGGVIDHDQGLASSNLINICGTVEWDSNTTLYGLACLPASNPVCSNMLPVELLNFTADVCAATKICLKWQTLTETHNDHYDIERSDDAFTFNKAGSVGTQALAGNSLSLLTYGYVDSQIEGGTYYYRLKQVDKDGASTVSRIVSASIAHESEQMFLVFPNYNAGQFTARLTGLSNAQEILILLKNESGAVIYQSLHFNPSNEDVLEFDVVPDQQLSKGNYFCSFVVNSKEHAVKVVVVP